MKSITKAYKLEHYDAVKHEGDALRIALHLALTTTPDATERFYESDMERSCSYTYRLYGASRHDGGIVLSTFHAPGQADTGRLLGHLDYLLRNTTYGTEFCLREAIALDKLRSARYRIINPQLEQAS